jgi:hypothetical protein
MKTLRSNRSWSWLAALAGLTGSGDAPAQTRYVQPQVDPQWMRFNIRDTSLGLAAEGERSVVKSQSSGADSSYERLFFGPSLGLNFDGSIYHPNLLQYSVESDNIFGWNKERTTQPGGPQTRDEFQYLGRFSSRADVLPGKPYHGSLFGGYSHDYRDYDVFNRAIVDNWNYGARADWDLHPMSFGASYHHYDDQISTLSGLSSSSSDTVGLSVAHTRDAGQTSLGGSYSQYSHLDYGTAGRGSSYSASLADTEQFGDRRQGRLESSISYFRQDYVGQPNEQFTGQGNLTVEHRPTLTSSYGLTFDRYQTDSLTSDNVHAQAQLQHRLYESLTSTLLVRGANYEVTAPLSSGYTRRYGVGWSEHYTKTLSPTTRLTINSSLRGDHVEQQNLGSIQNEAHTYGAGGAPPGTFFLNTQNAKWSSVAVWKTDRSQRYIRGIDYELFLNGTVTQVQRLAGSIMDASVVVDYDVEPLPGGQYEALAETFEVRFSLLNNRWALYTRGSLSWNNAPATMRISDVANYAFGTDYTWRWLRAGAEYSIYDSGYARYNMTRLYESANVRFSNATSAGLDFSQSWLDYTSSDRQEQNYRFTAFIHRAMSRHLRLNARGGYDLRVGPGVDQELVAFRFDLDYNIGRTTLTAAYDYEHDVFLESDVRYRHLFTLRVQRAF